MFRDQATVLTVLYSTTDIVVSYPATDDIVVSCSLWSITIVEPMSFAAAAATLQQNRNRTMGLKEDNYTGIKIVVSGGMSMPQILSTLDTSVNVERHRRKLKKLRIPEV
ncbi:hypothetical protein Tco_1237423 [Tanacetum coccineum]